MIETMTGPQHKVRAMLLDDRVAIVSGIGPGMGRDISMALAREGAHIVMGARTESKLAEVAAEVEALGRKVVYAPTDITVEGDCGRLAEAAQNAFGRIDILVNNAFIQPPFETIEDNSMETWQTAFDINVFGSVRMTKAVIPYMKERRSGSIIFINSMSSRRVRKYFGPYSATKSALITTARILAKELGEYGIRVNSVVPGYIWGPSVEWFFEQQAQQRAMTPQEVYDEVASETCLHHLPTSAEIADTVLFFASDLSRVVTGQALDVNAGHWFE
jgi:NAD(P)-dependent dehydrogenase (short-subunit alcohol dehydrogenase family)